MRMFQYHTGPIKSPVHVQACTSVSRFNTTLVQLKAKTTPRAERPNYVSFNTTLVQLKATPQKGPRIAMILFQYHTGPIKSSRARARARHRRYGFNTTLVQLKVRYPREGEIVRALFQYHTGPIKSPMTMQRLCKTCNRFNTTLVQLKARPAYCGLTRLKSFNTTLVQLKGRGRRREGLIGGKG